MATIILSYIIFNFHAYYISFTEMEYNPNTKEMEVSVKLTGHDLDKEINSIYKVDFQSDKQSDENQKTLKNYLEESFILEQNNKKLKLILDGYESDVSGDMFIFFHFEKFSKKKDFKLKNNILLMNFSEQQNIINIKVGKKKWQKTLTIKDNTLISNEG